MKTGIQDARIIINDVIMISLLLLMTICVDQLLINNFNRHRAWPYKTKQRKRINPVWIVFNIFSRCQIWAPAISCHQVFLFFGTEKFGEQRRGKNCPVIQRPRMPDRRLYQQWVLNNSTMNGIDSHYLSNSSVTFEAIFDLLLK